MLLRNDLEELKKSIDLLDYIVKNNSVCDTHKYGNLVRINPCPICGKRDHFDVHIDTNSYFSQSGCCNGGSIIDYMIEGENLSKIEAINKLKSLTGNYEEFKPKEIIEQNKVKYDFTPLIDSAANKVKDTNYFKDRGFSEETIKRHKLGYFNTGLNYAISKYPELFSEGKKTNDYFKGFKYFIPCFNKEGVVNFFINRYDDCVAVPSWVSKHTKVMNPKGATPIPLNLKYLYQQFKESEYIFLCEGWADALSCEEIGYKAIALNSTSNHRILTKYIDEIIDTDLLSNKIFIICGDNDSAGSILNNNLKEYFRSKNIPFEVFKLPNIKEVKDLNDLLVKDRNKFIEITSKFISKIKDKSYVFNDNASRLFPVYEQDNCYWKRLKNQGKECISNFIIEPITIVDNGEFTEIQTNVISNRGITLERIFTLNDFLSVQKFKTALNHFALSFTGKDIDLENIKNIISFKECNVKKGVNCTGFHKVKDKWFFITEDKCIDEVGKVNDDVVMSKHLKEIDTEVLNIEPITRDELIKLGEHLFKFNDLKKTSIILGYCGAIWTKEILWKNKLPFPHLLLIGEAGSGKSSTYDNVIEPILNIKNKKVGASGITKFSLDRLMASSNTIPMVIEEYKPYYIGPKKVNLVSTIIRESYDHSDSTRGTKDRRLEKFTYSSPLIIIGEVGTDETAAKERSLLALFSKKDISENNCNINYKFLLRNTDLLRKLGRSIFNEVLYSDKNNILNELSELEKYIDPNIKVNRIVNSVNIALLGLSIIEKVFNNLQLNLKDTTGYTLEEMYKSINIATFEDLLDSNESSKSIVDITLESFNVLASNNDIFRDFHYTLINGGTELALHMTTLYPVFNAHKINLQTEYISSVTQFNKQLRSMPYYNRTGAVKLEDTLGSKDFKKSKKCIILDISKMKERGLEISQLIGEEYTED